MVAYDAHVVDRPGEEDTLACLVAHSKPLRALRPVVGLLCLQLEAASRIYDLYLYLILKNDVELLIHIGGRCIFGETTHFFPRG